MTASAAAQTAEMIKTAAQPPDQRARFIEKSLNEFARLPSDETVRAFGMKLESRMVEARCPTAQTSWLVLVALHIMWHPHLLSAVLCVSFMLCLSLATML